MVLLIAYAMEEGLPMVTGDSVFRQYGIIPIW